MLVGSPLTVGLDVMGSRVVSTLGDVEYVGIDDLFGMLDGWLLGSLDG